jgi:hypothetical protein
MLLLESCTVEHRRKFKQYWLKLKERMLSYMAGPLMKRQALKQPL